ncbi:MAG: potassium-transporting ATPase subunit F [Microcystis sp.]|jgi:K+-transporting ATPase KdpF subunit|uniref:Potassium-transporting ATPase subunit F n=1 Tax=Microcystis flos-aquae Mf_QC_C_20070823_S10D TaxID=2486236 RepID=A0A552KZB8_9CHRO|nr:MULTISPECIES: potassium-transporting ATPase subunit F [Microcystis]MCA2662434.1 potassium-transporting ATPase subunit F [Microcystis sp. M064S2]MCA2773435.1 potassium-transporting ATPase subunit F [Microcystis sp. M122S2]MCA2818564.1 potassium-transporting ATPase subunit F [Microcystis sp. M085S1]MCA2853437.1 potassium-transporting ATPase subunit F [Microcystis sp. M065S1]MCA2882763.1 potassium-transporting ATPase subunit F [Microcystis sp. M046S1]MCA2884964.1 potassium-transporting ATPase
MKASLRKNRFFWYIFLNFCLTILFSSIVQASTGSAINRGQAFALTLLGLVAFALFIYLFLVIFVPERF